jgi:hypothetical protein
VLVSLKAQTITPEHIQKYDKRSKYNALYIVIIRIFLTEGFKVEMFLKKEYIQSIQLLENGEKMRLVYEFCFLTEI